MQKADSRASKARWMRGGSEGDPRGIRGDPRGITPHFRGIRARNGLTGHVFPMCFCDFAHVRLPAPLAIIKLEGERRERRGSKAINSSVAPYSLHFRILPELWLGGANRSLEFCHQSAWDSSLACHVGNQWGTGGDPVGNRWGTGYVLWGTGFLGVSGTMGFWTFSVAKLPTDCFLL